MSVAAGSSQNDTDIKNMIHQACKDIKSEFKKPNVPIFKRVGWVIYTTFLGFDKYQLTKKVSAVFIDLCFFISFKKMENDESYKHQQSKHFP